MLSKNKIKYLKSLQLKKYRLQERKFVVEGDKIVRELLHSSYDITTIYATKNWIEKHKVLLKSKQGIVFEADGKQLKSATALSTSNEVIAEVEMPPLASLQVDPNSALHLYLEDIRDPGNMGTIIRSAAWFGLTQILCSPESVDFYNNKVLQATMGSFIHLDMITLAAEDLKRNLPNHKIVAATLGGSPLSEFDKPDKLVLVIGNEGKGISYRLLNQCDSELTIGKSLNSKIESLNAAISCSILLNALYTP